MKADVKSHRPTKNEGKIIQIIKDAIAYGDDLDGFRRWFNSSVKEIKRTNIYSADQSYKLFEIGKKYPGGFIVADSFEIWHMTPAGDKDRLIAVITKE